MKIGSTIVTFNRLAYTQRTIESYLANTVIPHELVVVDNASEDGTQNYLKSLLKQKKIQGLILNPKNEYPGKATNQGWELLSKKCSHLHRSDNDILYSKGWDKEMVQAFKDFPRLGQLGLINELYQVKPEYHQLYDRRKTQGKTTLATPMNRLCNIGGTCVILREIWDKGVRWKEDKWDSPVNEDTDFSWRVMEDGKYDVWETVSGKVKHLGYGDINKYFNYYFKSYWQRGWLDHFYERLTLEQTGQIKDSHAI